MQYSTHRTVGAPSLSGGTADGQEHVTGTSGWTGTMLLRPGLMVLTGAVGTTALHAHHTVQIMQSESAFCIGDAHGATASCQAVVIPPNTSHRVVEGAASATLIHLAPEAAVARILCPEPADTVDVWVRHGTMFSSDPIGVAAQAHSCERM